jgi:hypothetical protein
VREWGRIGQPGTVRETGFETESAAIEAGAKVRQRKEKRGYRLTSPVPLPSNAAYWDVCDKKSEAVKNLIGNRLDVKEGMHISYSCTDPHMTVLIFSQEGKQIGQNIHVCAEAEGAKWKFTRVHG